MKRLLIIFSFFVFPLLFISCDDDDPSGNTIFDEPEELTDAFDIWLNDNYTTPYNISFLYKFEHNESNLDYQVTPVIREKAIALAHLIKFLWLEAYDKIAGVEFTRTYVPRIIHIIGSGAYNTNNTVLLGTAEGGLKITLYRVNILDPSNITPANLNEWYFKTIHHEFAHILHQTVPFTSDFVKISNADYIQDDWATVSQTLTIARSMGFVSRYARKNHFEDFVEVFSIYVTSTPAAWEEILASGGSEARDKMERKFKIVEEYMSDVWEIDIHALRDEVQLRSTLIDYLDLTSLN